LNSCQAKSKLSKEIILLKKLICLPPPSGNEITLPIIHEISCLYKELCISRKQIPKMDRFGIYLRIENIVIECLELAIAAALTEKDKKDILVEKLKIQIEISKKLIRLMWESKIITDKKYLLFEQKLQQISKMASGWLKYLKPNSPRL